MYTLGDSAEFTHRVAVLDQELCQPRKCGLECIIYCPVNKTGGECIVQRPEDGKALISEDLCTGCGICIKKCPFDAIVIVNLAKELSEDKIHQYGINSFRFYRLQTPKKGAVVGLVGRNGIDKLIPQLGLQHILDRDIAQLSGGELQRLAVAIAAAKDSEYYFFDEPSSYNDVYQRLAVAKVIRELAEQGKNVMVVEHDMTLLDYLSDYVHIVYGEPGAYGIVSGMQSTKVGINNFLEGFLPAENVRFRDKAFKFDITSSNEDVLLDVALAQYSSLTKSFPSFRLKMAAGK